MRAGPPASAEIASLLEEPHVRVYDMYNYPIFKNMIFE